MSKPSFVYVTYIRSTPEQVWQALTDPNVTERYWYGYRVAADGKAGPQTIEMLDFVQGELHLDALIAAALGRGVRARYQRTDNG